MHGVSEKHKELDQWYKDIKKQLTSKAHENFFKRLQEIITIADKKLSAHNTTLSIGDNERKKMWCGIASDIDSWKGVEITACTKQKTDYKSYAITSRNWWNRNKAKIYGNHFFYAIIFVHIKKCVDNLHISPQEKQYHFVDIFDEILHAKIQFPQTRAQPIIPYQSFIQPNKFKYSSIDLLKTHGIHWNGKNIDADDTSSTNSSSSNTNNNIVATSSAVVPRQSYYIKDKDRSLKVNNSFMDSLELLKQRLYQRLSVKNEANTNGYLLKIKTENKDATLRVLKNENENNNNNQCLPPSVMNGSNIGAQALLSNANLNNNHNPALIASYPPSLNMPGNIPDMNAINIVNNNNTNFPFTPQIISGGNSMDLPSLLSSFASNNSPTSQSSASPISSALLSNIMFSNYGPSRGQTHSVSQQRYSPSSSSPPFSLPFNIQNVNPSYCSIQSHPVSGQLMLSLHIPLN